MRLLSREFTDATVISIGHRPELAAFHHRKIILERSRTGAKLVDEAGGPQPGSAPFLEQCGWLVSTGTPVSWFLSSGRTDRGRCSHPDLVWAASPLRSDMIFGKHTYTPRGGRTAVLIIDMQQDCAGSGHGSSTSSHG